MSEAMQRIIDMNADVLTPDQAAPVLRCSAQWLRLMGRKHPDQLPFPVLVVGNRVKIPRRPFLAFLGIKEGEAHEHHE